MEEKNVVGINLKFESKFNDKITREEAVSILNKLENQIVELCKDNNALFTNGLGNFIVDK